MGRTISRTTFGKHVKGESFEQYKNDVVFMPTTPDFEEKIILLIIQALSDELSSFAEYTSAASLTQTFDKKFSELIQKIANEEIQHFIEISNKFRLRPSGMSDVFVCETLTKNFDEGEKFIINSVYEGAISDEEDAAHTYRVLAEMQPKNADFWNEKGDDEEKHRKWIIELYNEVR